MMMASIPIASTVSTVSRRLSPFLTDELATASESTSAESRLAAVSKESRVRVDSSKKSVATTLPRRVGTLGMERRSTSAKASATCRTSAMPSGPRSATERRCWVPPLVLQAAYPDAVLTDVDHLLAARGEVLAHVVGPDRELAVAPVDHDGELHGLGPAEVVEGVQGGADGTAGEEDVVDQDHHLPGQIDRNVGDGLGEDGAQADVVPVEGHVEAADGEGVDRFDLAQDLGHFGGQRNATGLEADQDDVLDSPVALDDLVRHARQGRRTSAELRTWEWATNTPPRGRVLTAFAFGHCSSCRVSLTGLTSRSER